MIKYLISIIKIIFDINFMFMGIILCHYLCKMFNFENDYNDFIFLIF